jgi:hypothetical protein
VAKVPPVETLYQLIVPAEANVSKVAVPEMQTEPLVVAVIVGDGFIAIILLGAFGQFLVAST